MRASLRYYLYAHILLNAVRVPQGFPLFDVGPITWTLSTVHRHVPPLRPIIVYPPRGSILSKL